jgi:hypothetical protein
MTENIPEVAVTIAGFSGLLFVLRPREVSLPTIERFRMYFLLVTSLGAALLGLLPATIEPFVEPDQADIYLCFVCGVFLLGVSVWRIYLLRTVGGLLSSSAPFARGLGAFTWLFSAILLAAAFGFLPRDGLFAAGLWWLVFCAVCQFFIHIVAALGAVGDQ